MKTNWLAFTWFMAISLSFAQMTFAQVRPQDWVSHSVDLANHAGSVEVIELPYTNATPAVAAMLMVPGLFQNANTFDLLPEKNISLARYLMNTFHLKIYFLNARGLGNASRGRHLSIDDFAIDDIPAAVTWVNQQEQAPIYLFGHSQGAIEVQASLSGITHCGAVNCFQKSVADARQSLVRGIALSAGSVSMATANPENHLPALGRLGKTLSGPMRLLLDRIDVSDLVTCPLLASIGYSKIFEFLYHRENVSRESELALFDRTLETSWVRVILQFAEGVRRQNIYTMGSIASEREAYASGLANLTKPVVQMTYSLDPMAEPTPTQETSFKYIGSAQKKFFLGESGAVNQGHEDSFMVAAIHHDWDEPISWLMQQAP